MKLGNVNEHIIIIIIIISGSGVTQLQGLDQRTILH